MTARPLITVVLACTVTSCSFAGGPQRPDGFTPSDQTRALPQVLQKGKGAQWVQFAPHTLGALYSAIVLGPDNNLWFIDENAASLVRMALNGSIKEFSLSGVLTGNGVSM